MLETEFLSELIRYDSVSSVSNVPVSTYVEQQLLRLGCTVETIDYADPNQVQKRNVIGKLGSGTGGLAYFGHTDVVPADTWSIAAHGPFEPTIANDRMYGRGSCDMKGSIACALSAVKQIDVDRLKAPVYIVCTADEEIGYCGAVQVVERSAMYREMVRGGTRAIIGEPTSLEVVHAHKGTYGFVATSRGEAAHSSSSHGCNANLALIPFLQEMKAIHDELESDAQWQNSDFDPPTMSWNIGINDHTRARNIKAAQSICTVYFRPMPDTDGDAPLARAQAAAEQHGIDFETVVKFPPFHVAPDSDFIREILRIAECPAPRTVCYGTDGAVLTGLQDAVVLGPGSIDQAHKDDEWIALDQLRRGTELYRQLIERWCC